MKTLNLAADTFDQANTFQVNTGRRIVKASLCRDYQLPGDGRYWALNTGSCLKDKYSDADRAETARLEAEGPLQNGQTVLIDGEQYKVRVLGAFSDCALFDKL